MRPCSCPHHVKYAMASYEELGDCDIIINAIGKIDLLVTHNRDTEMNFTVAQVADFIPKIMKGGLRRESSSTSPIPVMWCPISFPN